MDIIDAPGERSEKSYVTAVILSGIFGIVGIHHLYVERWGMFILDFGLFVATLYFYINGQFVLAAILFLLDLIHTVIVTFLLLVGKYRDGSGKLVTYPGQKI
jgi:TM2 domain-containing membrane protein YozV